MRFSDEEVQSKKKPRCAKCGMQRQQGGFRFWRYGVGYCDPCAQETGPWVLGLGAFSNGPAVFEHVAPGAMQKPAPHTGHC